jgi:chromosome segregation ATPase
MMANNEEGGWRRFCAGVEPPLCSKLETEGAMKFWKQAACAAVLAFGAGMLAGTLPAAAAQNAVKKPAAKKPVLTMTQEEAQKAYDALRKAYPALVSETESLRRQRTENAKLKLSKKEAAAKKADLNKRAEAWNKSFSQQMVKLEDVRDALAAKLEKMTAQQGELKGKGTDTAALDAQIAALQKEQTAAEAEIALLKKLPVVVEKVLVEKEAAAKK